MLIRFLWTRPEEQASKQASKRTLHGIMDDAVDSLRENDSYGSLARFVEVDRRRLRIIKSDARSRRALDISINQISKLRVKLGDNARADPITHVVAVVDDALS